MSSPTDGAAIDYVRSEVVTDLGPDELTFLRRTAVLEVMSGPLCDAVLGTTGSAETAEMLESLTHTTFFVVPLDEGGRW
ncbi:MAG TPA: hypothetical protein VK923_19115 [Euzebyales bacterium]|nr:hypothetical protein [Euzebyales bacterium]